MTQTEAGPTAAATAPERHVYLAQVRYGDLDPQNHVNNVRMLAYLEDARVSFLRYKGLSNDDGVFGPLVVARTEADYVAPLLPRTEPVRVELWVTEVRSASFSLAYEIRDDDTVFLRARTVQVGFDVHTQRARRLDNPERDFLAQYS
ncbi:thioesterase family protein [Nocardiopsis sp. CNT312]|uniref:acyl-CoA thioesterase n=1 Tax=Nocardiopsis sp. CNT312 TaxID=1137268 RepID=UPI000491CB58|nr:thioesterase family protein [Nocardiopsis sp. CNT312]